MGGTDAARDLRRIAIGVPGTAMPEFAEDLSDETAGGLGLRGGDAVRGSATAATLRRPPAGRLGDHAAVEKIAFDAYLTFEQVETEVRAKNAGLASDWRRRLHGCARAWRAPMTRSAMPFASGMLAGLERAERGRRGPAVVDESVRASFFLLVREGFEAILIVAALMTFLTKAGATDRRRDVARGAWLAVAASLLTWVLVELLFKVTPGQRETIEGGTMLLAAAVLFYVSYWLLSRSKPPKWTAFVRGKMQSALSSGSGMALSAVAFLAVYPRDSRRSSSTRRCLRPPGQAAFR